MVDKTDTRDHRAIEQIDCPACGALKGFPCKAHNRPGRIPCCGNRRKANQERLRKLERGNK